MRFRWRYDTYARKYRRVLIFDKRPQRAKVKEGK